MNTSLYQLKLYSFLMSMVIKLQVTSATQSYDYEQMSPSNVTVVLTTVCTLYKWLPWHSVIDCGMYCNNKQACVYYTKQGLWIFLWILFGFAVTKYLILQLLSSQKEFCPNKKGLVQAIKILVCATNFSYSRKCSKQKSCLNQAQIIFIYWAWKQAHFVLTLKEVLIFQKIN